ncbi:competence protein CoiA family protein [Metabacillus dongyingensis]|uniref:competence protein CoiA n=1 Tax=Metabacillus dongyingensis TaxID=2874282 RepID=UPI003B8ABA04
MLVAKTGKGTMINLSDKQWEAKILMQLRRKEAFYCPVCENPLDLKIGSIKVHHFAHQKNKTCSIETEPESEYHLNGKLQLYKWLQEQGVQSAKLEQYLPSISQRPDVLFKNRNKYTAVEYQCSVMPASLFSKRTSQYKKAGIDVMWILGGKNTARLSSHTFRISPFQWLFARAGEDPLDPPFFLTYCSQVQAFLLMEHLIPFSKQVFFSIPRYLPLNLTAISDLQSPKTHSIKSHLSKWIHLIKSHRLKPAIHLQREMILLQKELYEKKQTPLSHLPAEAFLPIKTSYLFDSRICLWQTKILLFIDQVQTHTVFTLEEVTREIRTDPSTKVRDLTHLKHLTIGAPILEYLETLSFMGMLQRVNKHKYVKQREITWQSKSADLLKRDELVMKLFTQYK